MTFRAFIAVDIDPSPILVEFSRALKETHASIKMVNLENIHLTLKFLGDTDDTLIDDIVGIMRSSIEGLKSFEINFSDVGAFPNLNYMKVIWVGIQNAEPLIDIAKYLEENLGTLGFKREKRGIQPHITICRVKGPKKKDELKKVLNGYASADFGSQEVQYLRLKKSVLNRAGPTYSTVREVAIR
jgi:2'-5' RNA ligase